MKRTVRGQDKIRGFKWAVCGPRPLPLLPSVLRKTHSQVATGPRRINKRTDLQPEAKASYRQEMCRVLNDEIDARAVSHWALEVCCCTTKKQWIHHADVSAFFKKYLQMNKRIQLSFFPMFSKPYMFRQWHFYSLYWMTIWDFIYSLWGAFMKLDTHEVDSSRAPK